MMPTSRSEAVRHDVVLIVAGVAIGADTLAQVVSFLDQMRAIPFPPAAAQTIRQAALAAANACERLAAVMPAKSRNR
jgi:hypothetical protein